MVVFFHSKYKGAQLLLPDSINFTNFALTMCEDCTEEYWPEVMAVQLEQVQSVSMALGPNLFILNLLAFANKTKDLVETNQKVSI